MNLYDKFRDEAAAMAAKASGLPKKQVLELMENPPEGIDSDVALPCFTLAKRMRKNPAEIAKEIAASVHPSGLVFMIRAIGPYVNFNADWIAGSKLLLKEAAAKGYGSQKKQAGRLVVEFAHPNTHKAFHIGHVRNITLGESLSRLLDFGGSHTVRVNYQGDIGPHVAKCLWGLIHLALRPPKVAADRGKWLGEVYAKASAAAEDPKVTEEIRDINKGLYAGKPELVKLWKETRKWSLDYFDGIYGDFGAKFDRFYFESEVEGPGIKLAHELLKKRVAKLSDGAIIMDLGKYGLGVYVLLTKDGTPLYSIKDFVLAGLQDKDFGPDKIIHVVGSEQNLHFQQLFKGLELTGSPVAKKEYHLSYGLVMLESGKMKSREGKVILYEDLKDQMLRLAEKITKEKNPKLSKKELADTARLVALGALKYDMIKISPEKTITFDWDRALSFDGDTAPYIQYTHARACSILRKAGKAVKESGPKNIHEREKALLRELMRFPQVVKNAARDMRPHYIANYSYRLAKAFNEFYQEVPVLKSPAGQREFRLALVRSVRTVLKTSLWLLGIDAPERM